jgi:Mob1/phocein family
MVLAYVYHTSLKPQPLHQINYTWSLLCSCWNLTLPRKVPFCLLCFISNPTSRPSANPLISRAVVYFLQVCPVSIPVGYPWTFPANIATQSAVVACNTHAITKYNPAGCWPAHARRDTRMTSLLNTMFVSTSSPCPSPSHTHTHKQHEQAALQGSPSLAAFPSPPKPLEPVFTLAQSSSCIYLPQATAGASTGILSSSLSFSSLHELELRATAFHTPPRQTQQQNNNKSRLQSPQGAYTSPLQRGLAALKGSPHVFHFSPRSPRNPHPRHNMADNREEDNVDDEHYSNSRTARTAPFKSQAKRGTTSWQLKQFAEATLGSGSLRKAVKLPEGEDENEWLAVNGETG